MRKNWIPQLIITLALLGALYPANPPEYYALARAVCTAAFACIAVRAFRLNLEAWAWMMALAAAIYNPWLPLQLTWWLWAVISVATTIVAWGFVFLPEEKKT